jgi:hypothetical protein
MAAVNGPVKKRCVTCGNVFIAGSGIAKFCSDMCHIKGNIRIDGCWRWLGGVDKDGYGIAKFIGNRRVRVHRAAYQIFNGKIPHGMMVCHSCDTPGCVNPEHLFVGTALDNKTDSVSKRRHVHGTAVYWKAKLTEFEVLAIIEDARHRAVIADSYGVTPETIDAIRKRKIWKHLSA